MSHKTTRSEIKSFRIPHSLMVRLRAYSREHGITQTALVIEGLESRLRWSEAGESDAGGHHAGSSDPAPPPVLSVADKLRGKR